MREEAEDLVQQHQKLLQLSPEAIVVHAGGMIQYVNKAAVQLFRGSSPEQLIGKSLLDFLPLEDHALALEQLRRAEDTCTVLDSTVHKLIRLDGELFDAQTSSMIIHPNNGKLLIQTVLRDITLQVRREEELKENVARYQRLIKFLPEPIVVTENGMIIYFNRSAVKLIGTRSDDELLGTSLFDFIHPDSHKESMELLQQVMLTDESTPFQEVKFISPSGEIMDVEISSIRIDHYLGRSVTLSVLRDLTERKSAEDMIVKSEKLSLIGQLAAGVAHEIRNPLTSLKGFTQLLYKELGNRYSYLTIMLSELDRINHIVNEFMSLSKPHLVHFRTIGMMGIMESVISILESQAIMNNVTMEFKFEEPIPPIHCDENQLKQVFINIIKNAIDAMPGGGIVRISIERISGEELLVRIEDQGMGIPEDTIKRIGEPFFTTKEHGTGLGLMISHRIIEAHRGSLSIASKANQGTTVKITLPVATADSVTVNFM